MKTQFTKNRLVRRVQVAETATGEVRYVTEVQRVMVDVFFKVFQTERYRMYPKGLSGATYEVIQYLVIEMRKDNLIFYDSAEIAKALGFSEANSKKIKAILLDKDIIRPKSRGYMFSPLHNCIVSGDERSLLIEEYSLLPSRAVGKLALNSGRCGVKKVERL